MRRRRRNRAWRPLAVETPAPEAARAERSERPEGTASRLARLRARLAGSQSGLGRGLLALLSRDRLDEDTWESIEDTLLGADIGVAPTQQVSRTSAPACGSRAANGRILALCCAMN